MATGQLRAAYSPEHFPAPRCGLPAADMGDYSETAEPAMIIGWLLAV